MFRITVGFETCYNQDTFVVFSKTSSNRIFRKRFSKDRNKYDALVMLKSDVELWIDEHYKTYGVWPSDDEVIELCKKVPCNTPPVLLCISEVSSGGRVEAYC